MFEILSKIKEKIKKTKTKDIANDQYYNTRNKLIKKKGITIGSIFIIIALVCIIIIQVNTGVLQKRIKKIISTSISIYIGCRY